MFAQCSNCDAIFRVNQKQLDAHDGLVRCGRCREVFNAAWNLVDEIPATQSAQTATRSAGIIGGAATLDHTRARQEPPLPAHRLADESAASQSETATQKAQWQELDGKTTVPTTPEINDKINKSMEEKTDSSNFTEEVENNVLGEWAPISGGDDQLQLDFGGAKPTGVYLHDSEQKIKTPYEKKEIAEIPEKLVFDGSDDSGNNVVCTDIEDVTGEVTAKTEQEQTAFDAPDHKNVAVEDQDEDDITHVGISSGHDNVVPPTRQNLTEIASFEAEVTSPVESKPESYDGFSEEETDDAGTDDDIESIAAEAEKNGELIQEADARLKDTATELIDETESTAQPDSKTLDQDIIEADRSELNDEDIDTLTESDDDIESAVESHPWRPDPKWHDEETEETDQYNAFTPVADNADVESDPRPLDDLPSLHDLSRAVRDETDVQPIWSAPEQNTDVVGISTDLSTGSEDWQDEHSPKLESMDGGESQERDTPVLVAQEWYESSRQEPRLEPMALDDEATDHGGADRTDLAEENPLEPESQEHIVDEFVDTYPEHFDEDVQENEFVEDHTYQDDIENQREVISDLEPEQTGPFNPNDVNWVVLHGHNPLRTALWGVGCLLLLGALFLQVRSLHFDQIAGVPELRSYLVSFCKIAACEVPPRHDARRIELSQTRVTLHPKNPGALRVAANLTNLAAFAQPFPALQLTLTDKSGRIVGRRVYQPVEYLGTDIADNAMPTATPQQVVLDLAQPHETAVGFELAIAR